MRLAAEVDRFADCSFSQTVARFSFGRLRDPPAAVASAPIPQPEMIVAKRANKFWSAGRIDRRPRSLRRHSPAPPNKDILIATFSRGILLHR
jgi:hypothetical protein